MADSRTLQILITAKNEAEKQLNNLQKQAKDLEPTFQKMATAGAVAMTALGAGLGVSIKNASDLAESVNAVNVVFGDGAKKILEFGETANTSIGLSNNAFNQMSTQTGALLRDTGLSLDEVANQTITLSQRAADMASVFNTDVGDAMSAINQALRGETEAIRRYAGDVTDATLETYALSQGITKSVAEMTQQEKRLLRVDLIMAQTAVTANDFANTSDSLANRQRILGATLTNITTTIGNQFIPIITDLLNRLNPVIEKTANWIEKNPELTKNIIIGTGAIAGLVTVLGALGLILPTVISGFTLLLNPYVALIGLVLTLALTYKDKLFPIFNNLIEYFKNINVNIEDVKMFLISLKDTAILIFTAFIEKITQTRDTLINFFTILNEKISIIDRLKKAWEDISLMLNERVFPAIMQLWEAMKPLMPYVDGLAKVVGVVLYTALLAIIEIIRVSLVVAFEILAKAIETTKDVVNGFVAFWDGVGNAINSTINIIDKLIGKIKELNILQAFKNLPANLGLSGARANGGSVLSGNSYLVGERGPEIFTPSGSGKIIPNNKIGGAGGIIVNVYGDVTGNELIQKFKQSLMAELSLNSRI